jgi:prephenate dehydrogenase
MDKIKTITIIGMGLIGGSLGMAIKNKDLAGKVIGVSRNLDHLKEAKEKEALDEYTIDPIEASKDADIVFITTPIASIIPMLMTINPSLKSGAIVTDVGSSKAFIVAEAERSVGKDVHFIGGHPMAGSERSGIKAATKFLFEGTNYVLTPTERTDNDALTKLSSFIEKLDVKLSCIAPDVHDLAVAGISHMPLAVAVALVNAVCNTKEAKKEMLSLASSGFRDTTRIAAGSIEMGRDMFVTNKKAVLRMLKEFKGSLESLEGLIEKGSIDKITAELEKAKKLRTEMYAS